MYTTTPLPRSRRGKCHEVERRKKPPERERQSYARKPKCDTAATRGDRARSPTHPRVWRLISPIRRCTHVQRRGLQHGRTHRLAPHANAALPLQPPTPTRRDPRASERSEPPHEPPPPLCCLRRRCSAMLRGWAAVHELVHGPAVHIAPSLLGFFPFIPSK